MPTTVAMVIGASLLSGGGIWVSNRQHHDAILSKVSKLSPKLGDTIKTGENKIWTLFHSVDRHGEGTDISEEIKSGMPGFDDGDHHMLLLGVICGVTALLLVVVGYWLRKRLAATEKLGKGELTLTFPKLSGVPKVDQDPTHVPKVNVSCTMEHEPKKNPIKPETIHIERDTLSADLGKHALVALNVDFDGIGFARRSVLTIEVDVEQKSGTPTLVATQKVDCARFYAKTAYTDKAMGSIKLNHIRPGRGLLGRWFAKPVLLEVTATWKPLNPP